MQLVDIICALVSAGILVSGCILLTRLAHTLAERNIHLSHQARDRQNQALLLVELSRLIRSEFHTDSKDRRSYHVSAVERAEAAVEANLYRLD